MNAAAARLLKATLASTAACLVLLGGAHLGGATGAFSTAQAKGTQKARGKERPAPTAHAPVAEPDEGPAPEIPLGDSLDVSGQPMQLSLFVTEDPIEKVVGFYSDAFQKRGLLPIAHSEGQLGHVSVFDPHDGLQRFITALPQQGQTLVMVGRTNPRKPPRLLRGAKSAPFPVPEEHRAFLGYASEDGGARAQSGQYVTRLSVAALHDYYRAELSAVGFAERGDSADGLWLFSKGELSISVAAQALEDRSGAAVFVNRIEGGAP